MTVRYINKKKLLSQVKKKIINTKSVLDIGCGIRPQKIFKPKIHICFEPFHEYISYLQKKVGRKKIILQGNWEDATKIFPTKSVDTIFLLDVIEHLKKEDGVHLLRKTEKIAKSQIVIFTTLGFLPQKHLTEKDAWGLNGASWQEHKSGWLASDFDETWDIFISEKYHFVDNLGVKFEKPYGAMWAIKTIKTKKQQYRDNFLETFYNLLSKKDYVKRVLNKILTKINIFK